MTRIMSDLLFTLSISLLIQGAFFVFAAILKTDKVTDLSYGLTFVVLAWVLMLQSAPGQGPQRILALMVTVWGIRLAVYLLYRIIQMKRDPRFDGIRERFWKFFQFWFFQGVVVWIIMPPVTLWFPNSGPWDALKSLGVLVWAVGLIIETVADVQKFRAKTRRSGATRWTASGLWRYSRHPNYFGELLCWWGVFIFVAGDLSGWAWLAGIGPMTLTYLLLYVTGIPMLEKGAERKWGQDPDYQAYKRETRVLIPWPASTRKSERS